MTGCHGAVHVSLLEAFNSAVDRGRTETPLSISEERARRRAVHAARSVNIADVEISDGELGEVAVRRYRPTKQPRRGTLIWVHGGGWMFGEPREDDPLCISFAREAGVEVLAVDYRLAPEHPYPAAIDDIDLVVEASMAATGGIHFLAGASAGGNLIAGLALRRRDQGRVLPDALLLICPVIDDRAETDDSGPLRRVHMNAFWKSYLGGARPTEYAAPARATSLDGLPESYVFVTSFDPLRAEGIEFANRLMESSVPCTLVSRPGGFHGFEHEAPISIFTRRVVTGWVDFVRRMAT